MEEEENNRVQPSNQPVPGAIISPQAGGEAAQPTATTTHEESSVEPLPAVSQSFQSAGRAETKLKQDDNSISWVGPQFISHEKSLQWYVVCVAVAVLLGAATYFATSRDLMSAVAIALAITVFGFYNLRKPKNINYVLSERGISIGPKDLAYEELRTFTATIEDDYLSITLLPLKRFGTPLGLCYMGNEEEDIVNFLADRLPMERHKPDLLDRLMKQIRF